MLKITFIFQINQNIAIYAHLRKYFGSEKLLRGNKWTFGTLDLPPPFVNKIPCFLGTPPLEDSQVSRLNRIDCEKTIRSSMY